MRLRPALLLIPMAAVLACWFALRAQEQQGPPDPTQVAAIADEISKRSEHLKPMLDEVHPADWVAKGAPEAYVAQWKSLTEQNQAIVSDMAEIAQHPEAMQDMMKALFRVHRFDGDLAGLLGALRRYQNPALADLIDSVAAGDQTAIAKLEQYVLDLAGEKERQIDLEDKEAQRCRATLAAQPPAHTAAPKKTSTPK
jgi:hypothetical protein